jgi:putative oxidoreductase
MKNFLVGGPGAGSMAGDLGLLVLRVAAGFGLVTHGIEKFPPPDRFVRVVKGLGFPMPEAFAWLVCFVELGGGALLIAGLLARPASAAVALSMGVAFFGAHAGESFAAKEASMLYGVIAFLLLALGAGRYSVDRLIR